MSTRLTKKEVRESLEHWQKVMKLTNWTIEFDIVSEKVMIEQIKEYQPEGGWHDGPDDQDDSALAFLVWIRREEQHARILFHKDVKKDGEYGSVFNLETLCIHELIHIMLDRQIQSLPNYIRKHKKIHRLEEWLCNRFATIIHDFGEGGVVDAQS